MICKLIGHKYGKAIYGKGIAELLTNDSHFKFWDFRKCLRCNEKFDHYLNKYIIKTY